MCFGGARDVPLIGLRGIEEGEGMAVGGGRGRNQPENSQFNGFLRSGFFHRARGRLDLI